MKLAQLSLIALSFSAVGCPLLVDDHLQIVPPSSAGTASAGTAGVAGGNEGQAGVSTTGGSGGAAPINEGGSAGEPSSCGVSVLPPTTLDCPAVCDRCEEGRCIFDCSVEEACSDRHLVCPEGLGCKVECAGKNACAKADIACPAGFDCDVRCSNQSACKEARVSCNNANCNVSCEQTGACEKTTVMCADAQCGANCPGLTTPVRPADQPQLMCGHACSCNPC